jgi:dynein intermediate chain 1
MSFDLGMAVVDAVWAPYSSTVFVTSTLDKVYVYDLHIDKHGKLSELRPVK